MCWWASILLILGFLDLSVLELGRGTRQRDRQTNRQTDTAHHFMILPPMEIRGTINGQTFVMTILYSVTKCYYYYCCCCCCCCYIHISSSLWRYRQNRSAPANNTENCNVSNVSTWLTSRTRSLLLFTRACVTTTDQRYSCPLSVRWSDIECRTTSKRDIARRGWSALRVSSLSLVMNAARRRPCTLELSITTRRRAHCDRKTDSRLSERCFLQ